LKFGAESNTASPPQQAPGQANPAKKAIKLVC